jgi:anaerobic magnesium-protoporphyrin IX monomethyl ester cyclase
MAGTFLRGSNVARILLLNTTQWGRGITPIWVASHTGILRQGGHDVFLCDLNFLSEWSKFELSKTHNETQYAKATHYSPIFQNDSPLLYLINAINLYLPDVIFWSAISSHIHGEGEYSSFARGYRLLASALDVINNSVTCSLVGSGVGLLPYKNSTNIHELFPQITTFVFGDSERPLLDICNLIDSNSTLPPKIVSGIPRNAISDDYLYDYTLFSEQSFQRPYHGDIVRAVDYEFSRGCPYSCAYCIETSIQNHYIESGLRKTRFTNYFVKKDVSSAVQELLKLSQLGISFIRVQDTNFMSLGLEYLEKLADALLLLNITFRFYIETRPETIDSRSAPLLARLGVCGVGMGLETASDQIRSNHLKRYCNRDRIASAFKHLRNNNICRTSYNMIGLPGETSTSIIDTILFNRTLEPDDVTCAFFTPYAGTPLSGFGGSRTMIETSNLDPQLEYPFRDPKYSVFYRKLKQLYPSLCKNEDSLHWIHDEFPAEL